MERVPHEHEDDNPMNLFRWRSGPERRRADLSQAMPAAGGEDVSDSRVLDQDEVIPDVSLPLERSIVEPTWWAKIVIPIGLTGLKAWSQEKGDEIDRKLVGRWPNTRVEGFYVVTTFAVEALDEQSKDLVRAFSGAEADFLGVDTEREALDFGIAQKFK